MYNWLCIGREIETRIFPTYKTTEPFFHDEHFSGLLFLGNQYREAADQGAGFPYATKRTSGIMLQPGVIQTFPKSHWDNLHGCEERGRGVQEARLGGS